MNDNLIDSLYKIFGDKIKDIYKNNRNVLNDNAVDIEDLVQEAMTAALESETKFKPTEGIDIKGWMILSGLHHVRNYVARHTGTINNPSAANGTDNEFLKAIYPKSFEKILGSAEDTNVINGDLIEFFHNRINDLLEHPDNLLLMYNYGLVGKEPIDVRTLEDMYNIPKSTIARRVERSIIKLRNDPEVQRYEGQL